MPQQRWSTAALPARLHRKMTLLYTMCTSLLGEAPGGWCAPKRSATIGVGHEKKVDLGVLRGADHNGLVPGAPFSTIDGASVEFELIL